MGTDSQRSPSSPTGSELRGEKGEGIPLWYRFEMSPRSSTAEPRSPWSLTLADRFTFTAPVPFRFLPDGGIIVWSGWLQDVLFPAVHTKAESGQEPELWDIGRFYLFGIGVNVDLGKADAALRVGLQRGRLELMDYAAWLVRIYLGKKNRNLTAAEGVLEVMESAAPEDSRLEFVKALLLYERNRYSEARGYLLKVIPKLAEQKADSVSAEEDYPVARAVGFLCALRSGDWTGYSQREVFQDLSEPLRKSPWRWGVVGLFALATAGLVVWTRRTRERGPGFVLSECWAMVSFFGNGIGFMVPLGGSWSVLSHWWGAMGIGVAAVIAVIWSGRERYFGGGPILALSKGGRRGLWVLVFLFVGSLLCEMGLSSIYTQVTSHAPDVQLAGLLLGWETPSQLATVLGVGAIFVPLSEEIVFRGFLFGAVERRFGALCALWITSLVFAGFHGFTHALFILPGAFAMGWLRMREGNLRSCVLLHALKNTLAILMR